MNKQSTGTRPIRSDKYQYLILECGWEYDALCSFPDESEKNYEQMSCLRDQLIEEVKRVMKECLTDHQYRVMWLYYIEGMTQTEVSKKLGINQSSVVKSISGNPIFKNGKVGKTYGGSIAKLKRCCHEDEAILDILYDIALLSE